MTEDPDGPSIEPSRDRVEAAVESTVKDAGDATVGWLTLEDGTLVVGLTGAVPRSNRRDLEVGLRESLPGLDAVTVLDRPTPSGIWLLPDVFRIAG